MKPTEGAVRLPGGIDRRRRPQAVPPEIVPIRPRPGPVYSGAGTPANLSRDTGRLQGLVPVRGMGGGFYGGR